MKINRAALSPDYRLAEIIDPEKNKGQEFCVNVLSFVLTALVFVAAFFWKGFSLSELAYFIHWLVALGVVILGYVVYVFLHELVHFLFFYGFTHREPKYIYKFPFYVAVDSRAFLTQKEYAVTMLAPSVLFGILFLVMGFFLHGAWFWAVCFLQAGNIGGSAGDFFFAYKAMCRHYSLRVYDSGKERYFYLPERVMNASQKKRTK